MVLTVMTRELKANKYWTFIQQESTFKGETFTNRYQHPTIGKVNMQLGQSGGNHPTPYRLLRRLTQPSRWRQCSEIHRRGTDLFDGGLYGSDSRAP